MTREIQIQNLEDVGDLSAAWDRYVLTHPTGTIFHLTAWQRVLTRVFPYRPIYCLARIEDRISGVLPLFLVRTLPYGYSLVSVPLAVYGGICADDLETGHALLSHAKDLARQMKIRYLELRHETPLGDLPVKELYVTFRREIYTDQEKNLEDIPRKQRRMVRQGEKHGLTSQLGRHELLGDFYHIYSLSVRNLGTPVYPLRLFERLLDEFGTNCGILAVFRESKMVAGVMTFFFRDQVMPYYGGALDHAFRYAVNDFMYWKLLCYGAERGYKLFDFGRSKAGTGSYDFKRHWGFEPTPLAYQYFLVEQKVLPDLNPLNRKFSLPIQIWKQLPLPLTQWLGPKVVQFFP